MSKRNRTKLKKERRGKKGWNPNGEHRNKFANLRPGYKESESPVGDNSSGGMEYRESESGTKRDFNYRALAVFDQAAGKALIVGRSLPDSVGGEIVFYPTGEMRLKAATLSDVYNANDIKRSSEGSSVEIKTTIVVGRREFPAGDGVAKYYGKAQPHAFDVLRNPATRAGERKTLADHLVGNIEKYIPQPVAERTRSGWGGW